MCDCDHADAAVFTRRTLLLGLAGTALVSTAGVSTFGLPAEAATPGRTLRFLRYHSGERLTARYFTDGHYRDDVLQEINKLCRDLREKEQTAMDVHLIDYVYAVARAVDPNAVVEIISAYRTPKTNGWLRAKSSNVAKKSKHMEGRAMDIRIHGHEPEKVAEIARDMKRGGVGLYDSSGFVHLDTGKPRFWHVTAQDTKEARVIGLKPSLRPALDPAPAAGSTLQAVRALPSLRPF